MPTPIIIDSLQVVPAGQSGSAVSQSAAQWSGGTPINPSMQSLSAVVPVTGHALPSHFGEQNSPSMSINSMQSEPAGHSPIAPQGPYSPPGSSVVLSVVTGSVEAVPVVDVVLVPVEVLVSGLVVLLHVVSAPIEVVVSPAVVVLAVASAVLVLVGSVAAVGSHVVNGTGPGEVEPTSEDVVDMGSELPVSEVRPVLPCGL